MEEGTEGGGGEGRKEVEIAERLEENGEHQEEGESQEGDDGT